MSITIVDEGPGERLAEPQEQPFQGLTFVFTGGLDSYTRTGAKSIVEEHGGRATSSVSGRTDYVVVGTNPGSKLDEARKRGTTILSEEEFLDMIPKEDLPLYRREKVTAEEAWLLIPGIRHSIKREFSK